MAGNGDRPLKAEQWVKAAVEHARFAIAVPWPEESDPVIGSTDLYDHANPFFWAALPEQDGSTNHWRLGEINHSYFLRTATGPERELFVTNQTIAFSSLVEDMLAIDRSPLVKLKEIANSRYIKDPANNGNNELSGIYQLVNYIWRHRDQFGANPALHFITDFSNLAFTQLHEHAGVRTTQDLSWFICAKFREQWEAEVTPGQIVRLLPKLVSPEDYVQIQKIMTDRREEIKNSGKKVIPAVPRDPASITPVSDAGIEFQRATQRPGRGRQNPYGGRAGWGAQKPDLWKPKP